MPSIWMCIWQLQRHFKLACQLTSNLPTSSMYVQVHRLFKADIVGNAWQCQGQITRTTNCAFVVELAMRLFPSKRSTLAYSSALYETLDAGHRGGSMFCSCAHTVICLVALSEAAANDVGRQWPARWRRVCFAKWCMSGRRRSCYSLHDGGHCAAVAGPSQPHRLDHRRGCALLQRLSGDQRAPAQCLSAGHPA